MAIGARQGFSGTLKRMAGKSVFIPVCASFFAGAVLAGFFAPMVVGGAKPAPVAPMATVKVIPVNERIDTPFKPAREGVSAASPIEEASAKAFVDKMSAHIYYDPPHDINDFAYLQPDGQYKTLKDFRGRYVLFNLWATWCGYCLQELPSLDRLKQKTAGTNLDVVAISIESGNNLENLGTFLKYQGIGDVALNYDYDGEVQYALPASVLPVTFLVNPEGRVVYSFGGTAEWDSPGALAFLENFVPLNQ